MKKIIIFVVAGLLVGLGGGTFIRGSKERDIILTRMAGEKAVADSLEAQEEGGASHGADASEESADLTDSQVPEDDATVVSDGEGEAEPPHAPPPDTLPAEDQTSPEASPANDEGTHGSTEADALEPPEQVTIPTAAVAEAGTEGPARLAKIFGAMEAKDAAAVLTNLSDTEVQAILATMSNRKVAEILGEFDPERAASLSRVVLAARAGIGE